MIGVYQREGLNFFDLLKKPIERYLHQKTQNAGFFVLPDSAFDRLRKQHSASAIITHLFERNKGHDIKLGLVDVDIYSHGMNFIFGLADPVRRTAIVSTYRLTGSALEERLSKEVVHELGHLFGLTHCSRETCVMHFSNTIKDTDKKHAELCTECGSKVG